MKNADTTTEPTTDAVEVTRTGAMAPRMRVWYQDGSVTKWINPNRPVLLLVFEQEFGHDSPQSSQEGYWLVWHALGRPSAGFEEWIETVEDVERQDMELGKAYR